MSSEPTFSHPVYRWEPWRTPHIVNLSLGSDRYADNADPIAKNPIGFAPRPVQRDPLLWEGDNA